MKKVFSAILAMVIVLSLCATLAFAAAPIGRNFVDEDGDGVCDNAGQGQCGFRGGR